MILLDGIVVEVFFPQQVTGMTGVDRHVFRTAVDPLDRSACRAGAGGTNAEGFEGAKIEALDFESVLLPFVQVCRRRSLAEARVRQLDAAVIDHLR